MESIDMIDITQFNYWLIHNLEPISEADPIVLAKYVIALIKKDKPEKALRQICCKQLEYFLENETIPFVDKLFDAIKSKAYLSVAMPKCLLNSVKNSDSTVTKANDSSQVISKASSEPLSNSDELKNDKVSSIQNKFNVDSESIDISSSKDLSENKSEKEDSSSNHSHTNTAVPSDPVEYPLVSSSSNGVNLTSATSSAESSKTVEKTSLSTSQSFSPIVSCATSSNNQSSNDNCLPSENPPITTTSSSKRSSTNRDRPRSYSRHRSRSRSHSSHCTTCSDSDSNSDDSRSDDRTSEYNDSRSSSKSPTSSDVRKTHNRHYSSSNNRRSSHEVQRSRYDHNSRNNKFPSDTDYRSHFRSSRRHESPNRNRSRQIRGHTRNESNNRYFPYSNNKRVPRELPKDSSSKRYNSSNRKIKSELSTIPENIPTVGLSTDLYQPSQIESTSNLDSLASVPNPVPSNVSSIVKPVKLDSENSNGSNKGEKEAAEKGPYTLYPMSDNKASSLNNKHLLSNNPYFIEPYNPESANFDSSMLMQLMPNFFLNNSRFGLNPNSSLNNNVSETNSESNNAGFGKMMNYSGMRRRELVGVSIEGNDDSGFKPTQRNNRWQHHNHNNYNRNTSSKRENNIDILASASSNNSANKRYNSNNSIDVEDGNSIPKLSFNATPAQENPTENELTLENETNEVPEAFNNEESNVNNGKQVTDKTMLVIRKIPPRLNNIGSLNKHFSRFGTVVKINVCYENDPESALIQFSNRFEATAAIRSTDAVLNNRFIKVYWPKSVQSQNYRPGMKRKSNEFSANDVQFKNRRVVMEGGGFVTKQSSSQANYETYKKPVKPQSIVSNRHVANNSLSDSLKDGGDEANKTKLDDNNTPKPKPEPMKTISHQERSKQIKALKTQHQLLQETLANQKHLMAKMESAKTPKEKAAILKLLQLAMKNINETKKSIEAIQAVVKPTLRTTKINNVGRKDIENFNKDE